VHARLGAQESVRILPADLEHRALDPCFFAFALVGGSALEWLLTFVALDHLIGPLDLRPQRFVWAAALAAGCDVHRLEIDRRQIGVDEPARRVEAMLGS